MTTVEQPYSQKTEVGPGVCTAAAGQRCQGRLGLGPAPGTPAPPPTPQAVVGHAPSAAPASPTPHASRAQTPLQSHLPAPEPAANDKQN